MTAPAPTAPETTAAPAATPPPATPPVADSSPSLSHADVDKLLSFDPFSEPPAPAAEPPAQPAATAPVPGTPPAAPSPPAQPAPANPEVEKLLRELADARAVIAEQTTKLGSPPPQTPPGTPEPNIFTDVPAYEFELPTPLLQAFDSEDPVQRSKAIGAVMTGTARVVHQNLMKNVASVMERLPTIIQSHVTGALRQKEIFDDFYGTYKDLNNPALRPTIVHVTRQVFQEKNVKDWSQDVRDTIAQRVYALLGRVVPTATPPVPPAPFTPGTGVRGPVPDGTPSPQQDILNTLGLS